MPRRVGQRRLPTCTIHAGAGEWRARRGAAPACRRRAGQPGHVLVVVDDRNPLMVLVRVHAAQPFQHLEARDRRTRRVRRVPVRQHSCPTPSACAARRPAPRRRTISTWSNVSAEGRSPVDRSRSLARPPGAGAMVEADSCPSTRCDRETEGSLPHDGAEVSARSEYPAAVIEAPADGCQLTRDRQVFRIHHGDKVDLVRHTLTTGPCGLIAGQLDPLAQGSGCRRVAGVTIWGGVC